MSTPAPRTERPAREAAWIVAWFAFTRVLVVLAAQFGGHHLKRGFENHWMVSLPHIAWVEPLIRWDSHFYLSLAAQGYPERGTEPVFHAAFFPLYPMLVRAFSIVTGDLLTSALVLSNVFALTAAIVIWRWAGLAAALLFLAAPGAHFLSLPYTEALFCLLIAGALLALQKDRIGWAAIFGALASASRPTGVVISLVLAVEGLRRRQLLRFGVASVVATSGLVGYAAFCAKNFHDVLYFSHVQRYWGREWSLLGPFKALFSFGFDPDYYLVTIAAIAVAVWLLRTQKVPVALSAWVLLVLPLMTGSLKSMIRFQSANVPLFAAAGPLSPKERRLWIMLGISLVLMLYETCRYAAGFANN